MNPSNHFQERYMRYVFIGLFLFTFFSVDIAAQNRQKPCSQPEANQFDFWVGSWNLEWQTQNGEIQKGTNVISKILGGCVIEENFDGGANLPLKGISHSLFDRASGKWKQTWVDNSGSYLDFTGEMKHGEMILSRTFDRPDGNTVTQRMVFFNLGSDSLEWNWENSSDGGKTWNLAWQIKYSRKK